MSQEQRNHLQTVIFAQSEIASTSPKALIPSPTKKVGFLRRIFGKKVDVKAEDPKIIEFEKAVVAIGVDLESELTRPALFKNTNNVLTLPVLMKQAEDVHPYDEEQVEQTMRYFKVANENSRDDQQLPISIIADGLTLGNKGKVTEFEALNMPFKSIPKDSDLQRTENGLFAYQVVEERVINLLPSPEVENRLALLKGNQLIPQTTNNPEKSKALSTVVVIRRSAPSINGPESELIEQPVETQIIGSNEVLDNQSPYLMAPNQPIQIKRLDISDKTAA